MARTSKRISKNGSKTDIRGGVAQGVIGAHSVVIENFYGSTLPEQLPQDIDVDAIPPCPYPGLAYFGPDDADRFFGRDKATEGLARAVGRQSLTALIGASGSGKSSVVLAGLAPRLGAADWRFSHFRIGTEVDRQPFLALARALVPLYVASVSDTERLKNTNELALDLKTGALALRDIFADCRSRNKGKRILLIADQFEEVFTLVENEDARHRFIEVLLAGFPEPERRNIPDICLVLTLRADFYGQALRHRPLADALQGHIENLGPMNREELRAAIVSPAKNAKSSSGTKAKISFEAGLVETLLDSVVAKPGSLPLLQFALREMWGRQEKRTITRKSYDDIGGIEGALAQRAEAIFATLTENGANAQMATDFQRLFTRLVTLGEGQEDTRRVVERAELGESAWHLATRLADQDNRLVVTNATSTRETAELVHESLIHHWPKLVEWVKRDRAVRSWLQQLKPRTDEWRKHPEDGGTLLRGGPLVVAEDWLASRRDAVSEEEVAYIAASISLRETVRQREEEARLSRERLVRDVRYRSLLFSSIVAILMLGLIATGALFATIEILPLRDRVSAIASYATRDKSNDFRLRLILLAAALRIGDTRLGSWFVDSKPSKEALRRTLLRSPVYGGTFAAAAWDATGRRVVRLEGDRLVVHDLLTGRDGKPSELLADSGEQRFAPIFVGLIKLRGGGEAVVAFRSDTATLFAGEEGSRLIKTPLFADLPEQLSRPGTFISRADMFGEHIQIILSSFAGTLIDQMRVHRFTVGPDFRAENMGGDTLAWRPMQQQALRLPVLAEDCGAYAFIGRGPIVDGMGFSLSLGQFGNKEARSVRLNGTFFVGAVAITRGCGSLLVMRDETGVGGSLQVFPVESGQTSSEKLPIAFNLPDDVPTLSPANSPQATPIFAGAPLGVDRGWRVGWATAGGLALADVKLGDKTLLYNQEMLTGMGPGYLVGSLSLSPDGSFALLMQQQTFSSPVQLRAYNLDFDARRYALENLTTTAQLVREACRIARLQNGTDRLSAAELFSWLGPFSEQPCDEA